jgi:hypothetical protein
MATMLGGEVAPKKKATTTYGKGSRRRMLSGASSPQRAENAAAPLASDRVKSKKTEGQSTQPTLTGRNGRQQPPPAPTKLLDIWALPESDSEGTAAPETMKRASVKRKQSQAHPSTRQTKKQRSTSPDSSPVTHSLSSSTALARKALPTPTSTRHGKSPAADTVMDDAYNVPLSPGKLKPPALTKANMKKRKSPAPPKQIPLRTTQPVPELPKVLQSVPLPAVSKPPQKIRRFKSPEAPQKAQSLVSPKIPSKVGLQNILGDVATGYSEPKLQVKTAGRRRLIDALALQAEPSSDEEEPEALVPQEAEQASESTHNPQALAGDPDENLIVPAPATPLTDRFATRQMTRKPAVRFTYSQQRSMLAEDPMDLLSSELISQPLIHNTQSSKDAFSMDDDDEDGTQSGAIRSVHELRQAGANNRNSDELDDILDRVGQPTSEKPSSMRRTALLELAMKMKEKIFVRKFLDHGGETRILEGTAHENDIVSVFILGSILIMLMNGSTSGHLVEHLQKSNDVKWMLEKLIVTDTSIVTLAKERRHNLSKVTQASLTSLKSTIQQLNIWEAPQFVPKEISPRTVALKCLESMTDITMPDVAVQSPSNGLTSSHIRLFFTTIMSPAGDSADLEAWNFPDTLAALELYIAALLLNRKAVMDARDPDGRGRWSYEHGRKQHWEAIYGELLAPALKIALRRLAQHTDPLEMVLLELGVNLSNIVAPIHLSLVGGGLIAPTAELVCSKFTAVLASTRTDTFLSADYETLLLLLGLICNCTERLKSHFHGKGIETWEALVKGRDADEWLFPKLVKIWDDYTSLVAEVRLSARRQI